MIKLFRLLVFLNFIFKIISTINVKFQMNYCLYNDIITLYSTYNSKNKTIIELTKQNDCTWSTIIKISKSFVYKFLIYDKISNSIIRWESGKYRIFDYFNFLNYINNTIYDNCKYINNSDLPTFICKW